MVQDMALRYWVTCSRRFERKNFKDSSNFRPLKMKALRFFGTSVTDYPKTLCHIPEDSYDDKLRVNELSNTFQLTQLASWSRVI